jgi:hypothetical protein
MKDATTRALPSLEVIEPATAAKEVVPAKEKASDAAQTIQDVSTETWSDDAELHKLHDEDEIEPVGPVASEELHIAEPEKENVAELLDSDLNFDDETQPFEAVAFDEPSTIPLSPVLQTSVESEAETVELAGIEDLSAGTDGVPLETPEEAAQRIDAWFRSAKTLEDVPAVSDVPLLDETALDEPSVIEAKAPELESTAINATVDLGSAHLDELSDDFELEHASESPSEPVAPWDDSHHMDQLLADIQDQPQHNEFQPEPQELVDEMHDDEVSETAEPAADWMPEESLAMSAAGGSPQRGRSVIRTLVLPAVCGVLGLALGYYALLWIRGPQIDVLDAAKYLPKALLPASFSHPPQQKLAAAPAIPPAADTAAEPPANEPNAAPGDAAQTPEAVKPNEAPAEKLASFTEPVNPNKTPTANDDRYASTAPASDKAAEPAAFNPPPATPVSDNPPAPATEAVHISGVPSFSASDLAAALVAAKDAQNGLVNGSLSDGLSVAKTKGFSYSILADLAQKATFVDPSSADAAKLQQNADTIFRETLAAPHAREEVAQIVPKWIGSPNRKQGGVFFAGNIVVRDKQGSVVEGSVDIGAGQPLLVLLPPALAEKPPTGPVAVVGYIIDKPAECISGYTGTAPQAVFAGKLIPLQ